MREINGTLRGLLKKTNRPASQQQQQQQQTQQQQQHRKNRVVFDETRNEFFEADYIILIREDCAYSEEDEEPCSCGDHELVRICCEDGCQCNYENDDPKSAQSQKFTPPVGFVDDAALSPPDDYKDNSLKNSIGGSLGGHVFGAQHIQQLQVIQKLQQQRAAMLAARATNPAQYASSDDNSQSVVCTECAECAECSSKSIPNSAESSKLGIDGVAKDLSVPALAFIPLTKSSPERRVTQKEIIAGEERPKYIKDEIYKEVEDELNEQTAKSIKGNDEKDAINVQKIVLPNSSSINGILKGGKLWKQDESQSDDASNAKSGSEDENPSFKRSVRFSAENDKENKKDTTDNNDDGVINDLIPIKKHSTIFNNALRPNSAVRQLFPSVTRPTPVLTHEALRAFDESKRSPTTISDLLSTSDADVMRKTLERNTLRRSLLRKKAAKSDTSLEERIKLLTCDVDETSESSSDQQTQSTALTETKSEDTQSSDVDNLPDKFFSSCSSASSCSSSGSSQLYKKINEKLNSERKSANGQEFCENPVVIIPQDCRCPAAPDLGIGVHVPVVHTQIHQTPLRQAEIKKQFLSSLAPLTSCVIGQKDDLSYYTLAEHSKHVSNSNEQQFNNNNMTDQSAMYSEENSKVAPDVIAGTPGQEKDDMHHFAQQSTGKNEKNKNKTAKQQETNNCSDDDEQNDYGFNKRPTVRGITSNYDSPNKILEEMQDQLSQMNQSEGIYKKITKPNNSNEVDYVTSKNVEELKNKSAQKNWPSYSPEIDNKTIANSPHPTHFSNYYPTLPMGYRQTFHEHQQSMMYQNCHITTEKHISRYARSPSRRPESPPPMRNYHQTMVLIPYNTETCSQFTTTNTTGEHHIHRQNILEYQQVTQQTIRVPMGYSFPAMELHLVTGREQVNQFAQYPTILNAKTLNYTNVLHATPNFNERGVPEGAASSSDNNESKSTENKTAVDSNNAPGVFYAMNV